MLQIKKATNSRVSPYKLDKKKSFNVPPWMIIVGVVLIAIVGIAVIRLSHASSSADVIHVQAVADLGKMTSQDPKLLGRDAGISGMVGNQPFWTFGDTNYNTASLATQPQPWQGRSITGAYGTIGSPTKLIDPAVSSDGLPPQTVPFTPAEEAYNKQNNSGDNRIANWPAGVVPIDSQSSYVFFNTILIKPGNSITVRGNGVAKLEAGKYVATRIKDGLFEGNILNYQFRQGTDIFITSCRVVWITAQCKIGKVNYQSVTLPASYMWWDGQRWQVDYSKAQDALEASTTGLSINYNPYIKKYVAAYATYLESDQIRVKVADNPQGPWSDPQIIYTLPPPPSGSNYYAVAMHPEYDQTGKSLFISYVSSADYSVHMLQAALAPAGSVAVKLPDIESGYTASQTNSPTQPCNVQKGFFSNKNYRACIVDANTPISITSESYQQFSTLPQIKICVEAINSDQAPIVVNLFNNGVKRTSATLNFGSVGLSKLLACGVANGAGRFNTVQVTSPKKILMTKLTVSTP
jgi:hypothetical protein